MPMEIPSTGCRGALGSDSMMRAGGCDIPSDVYEVSFRTAPLNERSSQPLLIGIGDDSCGPLVGLFYDAPSTPELLLREPDLTPSHSHPSDSFRIVMKGELWVGQDRYHHGEFRLQKAGRPYGSDGDAPSPEGNWRIISFADRRGLRVRPTDKQLRQQASTPQAFAAIREALGPVLTDLLEDADDGVDGCVTTIDKKWSKVGHIDSSATESYTWEPIGDGGQISVTLMGVHDVGPVYVLQRTPAGRVSSPAATFGSDVFRCVIQGSVRVGDVALEMGDCRVQAGGVAWDEVIATEQGALELIVVGDRAGAVPETVDDHTGWAERLGELIAGLRAELQVSS